jgi:predicted ester cyclase
MEVTMKSAQRIRRSRRSRAEWVEEVERWRGSGKSAVEYAAEHGLHAGTLAAWGSKVRDEVRALPRRRGMPAFIPVRMSATPVQPAGAGEFEIVLGNGRRVRVKGEFQSEQLTRLLEIAERGAPC